MLAHHIVLPMKTSATSTHVASQVTAWSSWWKSWLPAGRSRCWTAWTWYAAIMAWLLYVWMANVFNASWVNHIISPEFSWISLQHTFSSYLLWNVHPCPHLGVCSKSNKMSGINWLCAPWPPKCHLGLWYAAYVPHFSRHPLFPCSCLLPKVVLQWRWGNQTASLDHCLSYEGEEAKQLHTKAEQNSCKSLIKVLPTNEWIVPVSTFKHNLLTHSPVQSQDKASNWSYCSAFRIKI